MAYAVGVLLLALGVLLSIALHEVGHLVPAKRFGVKVTQYMVGFGPTVWSVQRGETEYGLKAIPLGGYIRMIGMFPPRPGRPARADSTGRLGLLVEQAREDAQRDIGPEDSDRLFYTRSVPKRLVIMLGGPSMNLLIAVVLLTVIVTGFGIPSITTKLDQVYTCVLPVNVQRDSCTAADQQAPAAAAGLQPGDTIVAFDGRKLGEWKDLETAIRRSGGTRVDLTVKRGDATREVTVTPVFAQRQVTDDQGDVVLNPDGSMKTERVGFLGVSPSQALVAQPVTAVPGYIGSSLLQTVKLVARIPEKMIGVTRAVAGTAPRDPTGPVSIVGIGRFAGEVASANQGNGLLGDARGKAAFLIGLIASLNLALFTFNLVPLLPLDGGHAAGALWEGLRRRLAQLRKRPDPGPVDVARALPLAYGVGTVLIAMSALLILADIIRPIQLGG
jgi:membrane-associated protease RseP (regulator of RpoE activity)